MNAVMPIYDFQHLFFRLGNFRVQHLFYTVHASLDGKTSDRTAILALVGCHQLLTLFYKHFSVACQLTKLIQSLFRELPVFQLIRISLAKFSEQCAIQDIRLGTVRGALATTDLVCSSVNLGSTKTGINMDCVREMGEVVKRTAELTRDQQALGCAKLVIFCNAPGDNPFMAGAFHGVSEADKVVSVGVSGPGVVKHALEDLKGADFTEIAETIKRTAFKITRVGQLVAREASKRLGVPFGIIDLSLAPTPAVGDSVARIIEEMGIESCGAPGTTAALALLNDAVKKGGLMASSHVGGLSGAFIPVSEDEGMIHAVSEGSLSIEKLEAMTCVCSVGLDMIAIEGDTSAATISGIIADEAAIGMINNKTTAVRVIPVPGKKVGDMVEFGGLLGYCPIVPVRNQYSSEAFIARGGRIPAPIRSLTN